MCQLPRERPVWPSTNIMKMRSVFWLNACSHTLFFSQSKAVKYILWTFNYCDHSPRLAFIQNTCSYFPEQKVPLRYTNVTLWHRILRKRESWCVWCWDSRWQRLTLTVIKVIACIDCFRHYCFPHIHSVLFTAETWIVLWDILSSQTLFKFFFFFVVLFGLIITLSTARCQFPLEERSVG